MYKKTFFYRQGFENVIFFLKFAIMKKPNPFLIVLTNRWSKYGQIMNKSNITLSNTDYDLTFVPFIANGPLQRRSNDDQQLN